MPLRFPNLAAVRLAITSGTVPESVSTAPVKAAFGLRGEIWLQPAGRLPRSVQAALRRMDVWKLRMYMLSAPVLTAAVEWPLWGLRLAPLQWLGAAIILGGLAVLIRIEARAHVGPEAEPSTAGPRTGAPSSSGPSHENRKDPVA